MSSIIIGIFAIIVLVIGFAVWTSVSNEIDGPAVLEPVEQEQNPSSLTASANTVGHPASDANDGNTVTYWEAEQT